MVEAETETGEESEISKDRRIGKMAKINLRRFDGKVYALYKITFQKRNATAMKNTLKHKGWLARVTDEGQGAWAVWSHEPKGGR